MPILPPIDPDVTVLPMEYSINTIARDFITLNNIVYKKVPYDIIFSKKALCAAIVKTASSKRKGDRQVHEIVAMLCMHETVDAKYVTVENVWEDDSVIRSGLAQRLCETIIEKTGLTLLISHNNYIAERHFWMSVARTSEIINIFFLDKRTVSFRRYGGGIFKFDDTGIPESEIGGVPPETEMERIVLIAKAREEETI